MASSLESLLRHDRRVVLVALILVIATAWAWLLLGAGMGMDAFEMTRHSVMPMPMMQPASWDPAYAVVMFFMWFTMMVAMMLPSATPVILLSAALNRASEADQPPFGSVAAFTCGYLLAWAGFSGVAVVVQWGLERSGLITPMLVSASELFAGSVLIVAGLWQFSPWKNTCLRHCRSPAEFLSQARRPGNVGALRMGIRHGLYCLGCCWFLMALLFVGGVMNLYWIIGLAAIVWAEKVLPAGMLVGRVLGGGLVLVGALLLARHLSGAG